MPANEKKLFDFFLGAHGVLAVFFFCVISTSIARADPTPLDKPVPVRLFLHREGKQPDVLAGDLTAWDHDGLVVQTNGEDKQLQWTDLEGLSAYRVLFNLIDKKNGKDWLWLGTLAWGLNDTRDGRDALKWAVKMDGDLKADAEAVLASTAGILRDPKGRELMHDVSPDEVQTAGDDPGPADSKSKYQKTSPSMAKAVIAAIRSDAKTVNETLHVELKEVETEHFLIYSDWGPQGDAYLADNMEKAYSLVSKQFEIPATENVFIGKLSVYMFNRYDDFERFADKFDQVKTTRSNTEFIVGYYASRGAVRAHLAMSKPDNEKLHLPSEAAAETQWGYVLVHEFTHAFVARYRSPRLVPRWLNEGIAEVIASTQFPRDVRPQAIEMAHTAGTLDNLFDDSAPPFGAGVYPVVRTMTEMLIVRDRRKFNSMFDEIKAGAGGERALKDAYGWTYGDLIGAWKVYIGA